LFSLAACFGAIGLFASSLTSNQIVAFLLSLSLSFVFYYVFDMISDFPFFIGSWDLIIKKLGIDFHYRSMARGVIDTRDVVYFISVIGFFLYLTHSNLMSRKA
jgi:ABC-2 type transport system permease protein